MQVATDSTMTKVLNGMRLNTVYLSAISKSLGEEITSLSQISNIIRNGSIEMNSKLFPIGDQIVIPWKDMNDSAHNTDATAYQVPWDIVHHGMVTLVGGSERPGMSIRLATSTAATARALRIVSPRFVSSANLTIPREAR